MSRTLLLGVVLFLAAGMACAAPVLQDTLTFTTFDPGTLMNAQGWVTYRAETGGWGRYPDDYTYQVVDVEGRNCVVDSYRFAQNHGQGTAILLDWDGNAENGVTSLAVKPGMILRFGVSLYLQPYSKGWAVAGTGHVIWSFGPGHLAPERIATDQPETGYSWTAGRGPRVQYRHGYRVEGQDLAEPELRGFAPESATPAFAGRKLPTGQWLDLRLTLTLSEDASEADCLVEERVSDEQAWEEQGSFTFALDPESEGGDNPAHWNALLLDMPLGQWSKPGYGDPEPQMRDRLDALTVEVAAAGATGEPRKAPIFQGNRPRVVAKLQGPAVVFADEAPVWKVVVANAGGSELRGSLLLRSDRPGASSETVTPNFSLAEGARRELTVRPRELRPGEQKLQVVLSEAAGEERVLGSAPLNLLAQDRPVPGVNLVRNASFELDPMFSGGPMRQGLEFFQMFYKQPLWKRSVAEGWWVEGESTEGVTPAPEAHSGTRALCVAPPEGQSRAVVSAFNRLVTAGPVTLSAWVKTAGCRGQLSLDVVAGLDASPHPRVRQVVALPEDSDWTRLVVTVPEAPDLYHAVARLQVDRGTAWLDDVQIEAGAAASAFNLRPEEWLRLSLVGVDDAVLATWRRGDRTARKLTLHNDSRTPLRGTVRVGLGSWDHPGQREVAVFTTEVVGGRKPQWTVLPKTLEASFSSADLPPDAYVVMLTYERDGKEIASGRRDFAPETTVGGTVSNGMLRARTAIRFAVAPDTPPARIFGVGNSTLTSAGGSWFGGWSLAVQAEARPLGLTTGRYGDSDEMTYLAAAAGVSMQVMAARIDDLPAGQTALANPTAPGSLDIYNPAGWAALMQRAEETGRRYAANPQIVSFQLSNEAVYPNVGRLCPSVHADADFRAWCRQRFGGDLGALNSHWGTAFASWDEVEQVSSARFAEEVRQAPVKEGAAATDWMATTGNFSAPVVERMRAHPGWSLDWLRWWGDSALRMYLGFRERARQHDQKTLYGTNLCWPAFWPQVFMPFLHGTDNGQLDVQYTSGLPRGLGTPAEMMDSLEMTEGTVPGKPIWGIEVYYQPQWPAEYVALQIWGMLAHGITNDLTFAWYPYSDHGPVKEPRAWEKPDAHPMWFMIDTDGTKLPAYDVYVRAIREVRAFHQRFDGLSLRRAATKLGFYVSPDTANYVVYETANKPWESAWQRTRNVLVYGMRMAGLTVRYLDDETLPAAPGEVTAIVVPAAYALNQIAAEKLAAFARAGGTVILAGMTGAVDPWLKPYANVGGPAWAELAWQAPEFKPEEATVAFPGDAKIGGLKFLGTAIGTMPRATALTDAAGATLGWHRPWGKGQLIAYGVLPDAYTSDPHPAPQLLAWIEQWRALAGLPLVARWVSDQPPAAGPVGQGSAVVEVVVREKSPTEKLVFCLNQGGPGDGRVEVTTGPGTWQATDALTGHPFTGVSAGDVWTGALRLEALGYRVLRLRK